MTRYSAGYGRAAAAPAGLPPEQAEEVYRRHGAALYRQAMLILGDGGTAEEVAGRVIADECARVPASSENPAGVSRRLAVSVLRRCRELAPGAGRPARRRWHAPGDGVRGTQPGHLHAREREALSLVLFGGLGYRQAARELGVPAADVAGLLRAALISLARPARR